MLGHGAGKDKILQTQEIDIHSYHTRESRLGVDDTKDNSV